MWKRVRKKKFPNTIAQRTSQTKVAVMPVKLCLRTIKLFNCLRILIIARRRERQPLTLFFGIVYLAKDWLGVILWFAKFHRKSPYNSCLCWQNKWGVISQSHFFQTIKLNFCTSSLFFDLIVVCFATCTRSKSLLVGVQIEIFYPKIVVRLFVLWTTFADDMTSFSIESWFAKLNKVEYFDGTFQFFPTHLTPNSFSGYFVETIGL